MLRSIQWRITIFYVLLILISMGSLGFFLVTFVEDKRIEDLRSQLEGEALLAGETSLRLLDDGADQQEIDALADTLGRKIEARVTIVSLDGTVLGDSEEDPRDMENHAGRPEIEDALQTGFGSSTRYSSTIQGKMMYVAIPFSNSGSVQGIARVSLPVAEVEASTNQLITTIGLAMGITTIVAVLMAIYIARLTARPIRVVTAAAKKISAGKLDQKIYIDTRDETAELATAFNEMAQNLSAKIGDLSTETNKLLAVLHTMDDGVVMTDVEGTVVMANPAAARLFNFPAEKSAGLNLTQIIPDHEVNNAFRDYLRTGQPQSRQIEQVPGGKLLWMIISKLSYHDAVGALFIFQDLTEISRLQTTRQKFIANVSHELRTPLASIKAVTETLSEGLVSDPDVAKEFLIKIDSEVDRMTQMVRELAELSRIESGRTELQLVPLDINALVQECVSRLEQQANRKRIEIVQSLQGDRLGVKAESDRIQQVLVNILHNAIKFTPEGGRIMVSTLQKDGGVIVSVADNGGGISPDDLPHVFERFYKADKARSGEGTGLGLAIAKHIVQAHGGEIWAESELDQGSVFSFKLPASPEI